MESVLVPHLTGAETEPEQHVLALSRTRIHGAEAPTGRRLEAVKQMMMRVHRSSGHSGFSNLQRLLEARGSPKWAIELAGTLRCSECEEASRPRPAPPASMGKGPELFEILGTDVFEYEDEAEKQKYAVALWRDRASGLVMLDILQKFDARNSWSPTTADIIASISRWMAVHPSPAWLMTDAARYYVSREMMHFCGRSGIGFTVAPAEAHWLMGPEEGAISLARKTIERLRAEYAGYPVETVMQLTANAMNCHVGPSGFSAYQWVHGQDRFSDPPLEPGLSASKAMAGLLKARERARLCFEKEHAKDKFSKLANARERPPVLVRVGELAMLWRQKVKPGKMKGSWYGPLRVVLIENSTIWLASGSTLIRAKNNQVRKVSERERLHAVAEGAAILRLPVTTETLLKEFKGRFFLDVTGDVPSAAQMSEDLSATDVLVEPPGIAARADTWRVDQGPDGTRTLTRVHHLPRLFAPSRSTTCPVPLEEFTGERQTLVRPLLRGASEVTINDSWEVSRTLQDRWTRETRFTLRPSPAPPRVSRRPPVGRKRKAADQDPDVPPDPGEGEPMALADALQHRGADTVDGHRPPLLVFRQRWFSEVFR